MKVNEMFKLTRQIRKCQTNRFISISSIYRKDNYKVLGVPQTATQDEIREAFLKKSKLYHPDLNKKGEKETIKKFIEVNEAYRILSQTTTQKPFGYKRNANEKNSSEIDYGGRRSSSYKNPYIGSRMRNSTKSWTHYYNMNSTDSIQLPREYSKFWDKYWKETGHLGGYDARDEEKQFNSSMKLARENHPSIRTINIILGIAWSLGIGYIIMTQLGYTVDDLKSALTSQYKNLGHLISSQNLSFMSNDSVKSENQSSEIG